MLMTKEQSTYAGRLGALRHELQRQQLDGYVVPIADEHMSEYVGDYAQRLEWLTGFRGSAGTAAVLTEPSAGERGAAIFTDGRYSVQVREQVDGELYDYEDVPATSATKWLAERAGEGMRIGYDPWLHGIGWAEALEKALVKRGATLVPVKRNPIDAVWEDRPAPSCAPARPHEDRFAGRSSADKRGEVAKWLAREGCDATIITALDSVAWLLNMRGADVPRTPVALSYAIVTQDGTADLFIAPEKVTPELRQHLGNTVSIRAREEFEAALAALNGRCVALDPGQAPAAIFHALERGGARILRAADPTLLAKASKTPAEQQGHREAQARDGAAVARFLRWLSIEAPKGQVDELSAAARLYEFRKADQALRDLSFDTISAAAHHAALPHYKVDEASNIAIPPSSIYLVDSGGQYDDGTTDITRSVWIGPGEPSAEMVACNTRVLKGHIALARARFPAGTSGGQLDALARQHLWAAGLDYAHGTGHGVGSYLSVHEGPQRIAKPGGAYAGTMTPLEAGMICSNEPGYYREGAFGIRIENLVLVVPAKIEGAEGDYLGFETLTHVPLDRRLVDRLMLDEGEIAWWNDYHGRVEAILAPRLEGADLAWLREECAPL
jgi:Xaa-Pro aminopeptidase